jgi:hypothetical protein
MSQSNQKTTGHFQEVVEPPRHGDRFAGRFREVVEYAGSPVILPVAPMTKGKYVDVPQDASQGRQGTYFTFPKEG